MANLEYNIPITTRTIFDIVSGSKQFAAFAIATLFHEGKLSLYQDHLVLGFWHIFFTFVDILIYTDAA